MHISPVLWQFLVKWLNASALFPREASTIAPYADALYFFLLLITVIGLVLVGMLVFGFSIRYRQAEASGCRAGGRLDAARGDVDDYSAGAVSGGVCLGRAAVLPDLQLRRPMR